MEVRSSIVNWIVVFVIILSFIATVLLALWRINEKISTSKDYPYQKASLFTPAELSFLRVLYQTVGSSAKVFGKVRVASIIATERGLLSGDRQKAFNRISNKHFDFILCKNDDLSVICAIELNDQSHLSIQRKQRDEFLTELCDAAGLPLIQITAKRNYVVNDIKKILEAHIYID